MTATIESYKHTFAIGLFDCCREEVSKESMKKRGKVKETNEKTKKAIEKVIQVEKSLSILRAKMQQGLLELDEDLFSEDPELYSFFGKDEKKLNMN